MKIGEEDINHNERGVEDMRDKEQCCGTCRYHYHEDIDDGWVCVNPRSDYCTFWTEYNDWCEEWEER